MALTSTKIGNNTMRCIAVTAIALLMALPAVVKAQANNASAQTARSMVPASPSLPISFGDLIQVTVFDSPELSAPLRVNFNGEVELPLGGTVKVKGLTAAQAGTAIAAQLKQTGILLDPHVSVMIMEYQSQGVTVTGEVRVPGVYPLLANRTVMDMIALAGGLNENAGKVASVFHRDSPGDIRQVRLNVSVQTPESVAESKVELLPGDTISISRSGVIYVIGDVGRPGGYLVEHNDRLSLLEALALASGANQTASLSGTQLMRKTASGRIQYGLDLKKILRGSSSDPLLADGDILYIPVSYKKVYSLRAIEALIGVGSQIAIYKTAY
ncbi:MAG TPA: polysaccharide biosynthesis/export family protein [Terracidiphilus sp.]|jgi:polysaccharide export outer membrane protein